MGKKKKKTRLYPLQKIKPAVPSRDAIPIFPAARTSSTLMDKEATTRLLSFAT